MPACILLLLAVFPGVLYAQTANNNQDYEPGVIYLRIRDDSDVKIKFDSNYIETQPGILNGIFAQYQVTHVTTPFEMLGKPFARCYRIFHNTIGQEDELVNVLKTLPFTDFAERMPHDEVDVVSPPDCPGFPDHPQNNYYLEKVRACEAFDLHNWNNAPGAKRTRVAVVDNAIMADFAPYTEHEDLIGQMVPGWDVSNNDNDPNPPYYQVGALGEFTHGTKVASVAGARTDNTIGLSSLGWFNNIMPVKGIHDNAYQPGPGSPSASVFPVSTNYYDGVAWAAMNGAEIINMAWGSPYPSQMNYNIIVAARETGAILIATAGNEKIHEARYPASYGEGDTGQSWEILNNNLVVNVASLDANDDISVWSGAITGSNQGPWVDVSAYGTAINLATSPESGFNNALYISDNGTSLAAPQVSALAGLMWSYKPEATSDEIIGCILGTANPDIYGPAHPGNIQGKLGAGRLDAYKAMLCLAKTCNPPPVASIVPSHNYVCPGSGTSLMANTGDYFVWSTNETTKSILITQAGTYTVTVTFNLGCTGTASINISEAPTVPEFEIKNLCPAAGIPQNVIRVIATGSNFLWSFNGSTAEPHGHFYELTTSLDVNYSVTVTDMWGCPGLTGSASGMIHPAPIETVTISAIESSGVPNDGIVCSSVPVTLLASPASEYHWFTGENTSSVTFIPTDDYYLYAVNYKTLGGCYGTATFPIYKNASNIGIAVTESSGVPDDGILCSLNQTAEVSVEGCPGNEYSYLWSNGSMDQSIFVTLDATAMFTVTVTNLQNGEQEILSKEIVVINPADRYIQIIEHSGISSDGSVCVGDPVQLSAHGGQYQWNTGETLPVIFANPVTSEIYTVTITSSSCIYTREQPITVFQLPDIFINIVEESGFPSDGIICQGEAASLTAVSSLTNVTYQWSHSLGTNPTVYISPTSTTEYKVTVTASSGCTNVESIIVNVGAQINFTENSGTPNDGVICSPGELVVIHAEAGIGATYLWSTGDITNTLTVYPLQTTEYKLTIWDNSGCKTEQIVTVVLNNSYISISLSENSGVLDDGIICSGESVTLYVNAPSGATYLWNTFQTVSSISVSPPSTLNYFVTVSANGCEHINNQVIKVIPSPGAGIVVIENSGIANDGVLCSPLEKVKLSAVSSPGATYLWSTGEETMEIMVQPEVSTTYTVTVTGENGCTSTEEKTIQIGVDLTVSSGNPPILETDNIICPGEIVTISASLGETYYYSWSTGINGSSEIIVEPLETTTYTVTATDYWAGCTSIASVTITVLTSTPVNIAISENYDIPNDGVICPGTNVNLTAITTNATYSWSFNQANTSTINISPLLSGTYTVTTTNNTTGCTGTASVTITTVPSIPVSVVAVENADIPNDGNVCPGANVKLSVTELPNHSYQWSTNSNNTPTLIINPLYSSSYTVTVTDNINGCIGTASVTITVVPTPPLSINVIENYDIPNDGIICYGSSVTLSTPAMTNYSYQWGGNLGNTPVVTIENPFTGSYIVTATDLGTGCLYSGNTYISTIAGVPDVEINITDQMGNPNSGTTCVGSSIILTATENSNYSYAWNSSLDNTPSITVNPTNSGFYVVTVVDQQSNCTSFASTYISVEPNNLGVSISITENSGIPNNDLVCLGSSATLTATYHPDYSYNWSANGGNTSSITVYPEEDYVTYTVTVTDTQSGCTATSQATVYTTSGSSGVALSVSEGIGNADDGIVCQGTGAGILCYPSGNFSYNWSDNIGTSSYVYVSPDVTTTYTVTVTNPVSGCSEMLQTTITVIPNNVNINFTIDEDSQLPDDGIVCFDDYVSITASGGDTYLWSNSATTPTIETYLNTTTIYSVTVTDSQTGCYSMDDVEVSAVDCTPPQGFTCPCSTPGSISIDAGTGTLLSSIPILNNLPNGVLDLDEHGHCLAITGKLIIDKNFTITDSDLDAVESTVLMNPSSEIEIQATRRLDLTSLDIHGCQFLWKGITVLERGKLWMGGNNIYDAEYAVTAIPSTNASILKPTEIRIAKNRFINNHVGVRILEGALESEIEQIPFISNEFSTQDGTTLLFPQYGGIPNFIPDNGYTGVVALNAQFSVGANNKFIRLRNGIISENCRLEVDGCIFSEIIGEPSPFANYNFGAKGIGVLSNYGQVKVLNSRMSKLHTGVFTFDNPVTVSYNKLNGVVKGIQSRAAWSMDVVENTPFKFKEYGITVSNFTPVIGNGITGAIKILGNKMQTTNAVPFSNDRWAIEINNIDATSPTNGTISGNGISINDFTGGIQISNTNGWTLTDNDVNYEYNPAGEVISSTAFHFYNSSENVISGNFAGSDDPGIADAMDSRSYLINMGQQNTLCCNTASKMTTGFEFLGTCTDSEFRFNTIEGTQTSLLCQDHTRIGVQDDDNGNLFMQWSGTAKHLGDYEDINESKFVVYDENGNFIADDVPYAPESIVADFEWFKPDNTMDGTCEEDMTCENATPGKPGGTIKSGDLLIVAGPASEKPRDLVQYWEGVRNLYLRMNKFPGMHLENSDIDAFYDEAQTGKIGQYHSMEQYIHELNVLPAVFATELGTIYTALSANDLEVNQRAAVLGMVTTWADSLDIYSDIDSLRQQITPQLYALRSISDKTRQYRQMGAENLLAQVGELPADNIVEKNRKAVYAVYLHTMAKGQVVLSEEDFATVAAIAHQCPLEGGSAVYLARGLYQYNDRKEFNDLKLCDTGGHERSDEKPLSMKGALKVIPNPANDWVDIVLPGMDANSTIHLVDISGRTVYPLVVFRSEGRVQLQLTDMPQGLYFCTVTLTDGSRQTAKVFIQH